MINAYNEIFLEDAMDNLGDMLEFSYNKELNPVVIWNLFCNSNIAQNIEKGDVKYISGCSGEEYIVLLFDYYHELQTNKAKNYFSHNYYENQCYWAGSSLAYLQCKTDLSFSEINEYLPISEVLDMYNPLHEADITKFLEIAIDKIKTRKKITNLKRQRKILNITQKDLAERSGVDISTIQKYEQRVLDINKASVEILYKLTKPLYCTIEDLIEKI